MGNETRLERWQRTGVLHIIVALVVFATWVYFQVRFPAAERPIVLNEVLLLVIGWFGAKFFIRSTKSAGGDEEAGAPASPAEPEKGGRHAK